MVSEISTSFHGQSASQGARRGATALAFAGVGPSWICTDGSGGFIRARIGLSG